MKDRPVGILPVGAIEAHGPHLPLNADTVIAVEMAKRGAAKLKEHGVSADPASRLVHRVGVRRRFRRARSASRPRPSVALLRDVCVDSRRKRFRAVALANIHLEPAHIECVKAAVEEARKLGASVCWPDVARSAGRTCSQTFRTGRPRRRLRDSLMMAAAPQLVRERERISLPPVDGLQPALKKGAKNFKAAGGETPTSAIRPRHRRRTGEASFEALGEILSVSIMEHLGSKAVTSRRHPRPVRRPRRGRDRLLPNLVNFLHEAFEDFFVGHVGRPLPEVFRDGLAIPTVKLEMEFCRRFSTATTWTWA
jgi:creatinine amidohydrolase